MRIEKTEQFIQKIKNVVSYFSSAVMIRGGSTRIGMGRTILVKAVSKSA